MTLRPAFASIALLAATAVAAAPARAAETAAPAPNSPQAIEFFETHVRPILVDTCYKCHSAQSKKLKGGLYLDSREGLLKGGKTGPALVPGDPDKSLLIKAVRYTDDDLQMPPKDQLSKEQVAALETWVKMGAPDPRTAAPAAAATASNTQRTVLTLADSKNFWSFKKPVQAPIPPTWSGSPIDYFITQKLQSAGLEMSPPADKRTLIRRATFDLTGLPPTVDEIAAFEADTSPNAFEKVLDRLLASPAYGQRWARHWLDLARYADTKGYVFQEERRYPYAYTYRDWIVNALNADMPYDQFLINQIAADRVLAEGSGVRVQGSANAKTDASPSPSSSLNPEPSTLNPPSEPSTLNPQSNLAAMGFLTLGRRFLNAQPDIIDDRIDVITRGTMALTVACARCHDHKFDPIPTADYYSLYGVLASSVEPKGTALPLLDGDVKTPERQAYEKELAAREADIQKFKEERLDKAITPLKSAKSIQEYLLATAAPQGTRDAKLNRFALRRWRNFLDGATKDPAFAPWHKLASLPEKDFAAQAPQALKPLIADPKTPPALVKAFAEKPPTSLSAAAAVYADFLQSEIGNPQSAIATAPNFPTNLTLANVESVFSGNDRSAYNALLQKRDAVSATHPGAPARAMVLVDAPTPVTPVIFKRGNARMPGAQVPRQFLACIAGENRKPFKDGSGRLELARDIASKDNPLTARVFVNRVWAQHFGKGIVGTPSDFGIRGDRPTHPQLLDYLAVDFMNHGWSIKHLQKTIMLSAAYRQSSTASPKALHDDADNRLLSHQNRQRLDFEAMRDSLLFAAGRLDTTLGGKAVDLLTQPFTHRRTIYGFVDRQNLPNLFRSFDFASPDQHAPRRFTNTVPQQALFMMNSPFVVEQAKALATRATACPNPTDRVRTLYRAVLARDPSQQEIELALNYIESESTPSAAAPTTAPSKPPTTLSPWERYAQVLLETNEFVFVD